jgi:membrane dipeptidase
MAAARAERRLGDGRLMRTPIVDGHLDLAWNAVKGRDLTRSAHDIRADEQRTKQQCMVSFPDMRRGDIAIVFASIFVMDRVLDGTDHDFDPELGRRGKEQIDIYRRFEDEGHVRIIRTKRSLDDHLARWQVDSVPGLLIAMEGAEPIEDPSDLQWWFDAGLRMASTAWGPSRYSGGYAGSKGVAGGLTPMGHELVAAMSELGIAFDLCHSSPELFWDGVRSEHPNVVCTHTAPRELNGRARMPDGEMIAALAARGGIIGLGLGNIFLDRAWLENGSGGEIGLSTAADVFALMATFAGWDHIAIGSDLDGGIGLEETPVELDTIADIRNLAGCLPDGSASAVLGGNWIEFLRRALPDRRLGPPVESPGWGTGRRSS